MIPTGNVCLLSSGTYTKTEAGKLGAKAAPFFETPFGLLWRRESAIVWGGYCAATKWQS